MATSTLATSRISEENVLKRTVFFISPSQGEWAKEEKLEKEIKNYRASLKKAVFRAFGYTFILQSIVMLIQDCLTRLMQPVCLGWIIRYYSVPGSLTATECYFSAAGLCFFTLVYVCMSHPLIFGLSKSGMKLRIATCTLIYRKSLKLSQKSVGETTVGQMVNLLSNDVNRFELAASYLPSLVVGPVQTAVAIAILWQHLGVSCLLGLAFLLLFIPFQSQMGRVFSKQRSKTAVLTDKRVGLMNEIVSGMKVIKMYTWEYPFARLVNKARRKEMKEIRLTSILRGVNLAVYFAASKVIIFICFVAFVLLGHNLTAEIVFVSMSLFNNVRLTMTFLFPLAVANWNESFISISRIQKFLELEEIKASSGIHQTNSYSWQEKAGIWLQSISAKWNKDLEEFTLNDISMNVLPGEIWAVVGSVGSGKSSLLMSILGELPVCKGDVKVGGRMVYSSQEPWVFGGTIQQNVLFGRTFDQERYRQVLTACSLDKDLDQLPYGDRTIVGEKGVVLSGGQKARVNLARAVYADGDVYLLDDPLSAVDVSVAKHLFEKCITGYLKDKPRVLVTHQIQFLKSVDRIIILKKGRVEALGTYKQLIEQGFDLWSVAKDGDDENKSNVQSDDLHVNDKNSLQENILHAPYVEEESDFKKTNEIVTSNYSPKSALKPITSLLSKSNILPSTYGSVNSSIEVIPSENKNKEVDSPKQTKELKTVGSLKASTYCNYFTAGGGSFIIVLVVLNNILAQLIYSFSDYWLSLWTNAETLKSTLYSNSTSGNLSNSTRPSSTEELEPFTWEHLYSDFSNTYNNICIYTIFISALFVLSLTRTVSLFLVCMKSAVNLHDKMFRSVSRAPISFFEKNPIGRILNRFTKDLGLMDDQLAFTCVDMANNVLLLLGIVVLVTYISPFVAVPTFFLIIVFVFVRKFYIHTARDLKRLEGTTRSPVFSHVSSTYYGITTIRSFGMQKQFERDFCSYQDNHTSAFFTLLCVTRWFAIVLEFLTVLYITFLTICLLAIDTGITGGNIGLAISSALVLTGTFQWAIRQSADLESQMTAVERVLEYCRLNPEAALEAPSDKKPNPEWPTEGAITMKDFSLTYPESGEVPVLKSLNCHIQGGEKVGIVGRTGAGKSSIVAALFRMVEPTGVLTIDGVDTKEIGLHDLRSRISIIPQEPILFSGLVRRNLDPFGDKNDNELWSALEEVQLKATVKALPDGLDNQVSESGNNFSVGQRQLICLARALLRRNKILVLDEATANVDIQTDDLIQKTIRDKFGDCTVLTIAHRLHTIMDSDKILVLDAGEIVEFDTPWNLLQDESSYLTGMVKQTGPVMRKQLYEIAKEAQCLKKQ